MKKQLKDICRGFTKNIALKDLEQHEGQFPIYGASGYIKDIDFYSCDTPYIGIVKDGSGVGRVDVYPGYSSLLGTMQYVVPNDDVDLHYLKYALTSMKLGSLYKGAAIPHIYFKEYGKFFVNLPDLEVQRRISSELNTIQHAIDLKRKQLTDLDELVKSKFQEMFGDPVENEKGWEMKNFGELASFKNGLNYSPNEEGEEYHIIGVGDFQSRFEISCDENLTAINLNGALNGDYLLQDNDILFVRSNGNKQLIGRNILVKTNMLKVTFSGFCIRARMIKSDVSPFFVNYLLKMPSSHEALTNRGGGCNISNLNQNTLNDFGVILPPIEQQTRFVDFAREVNAANAIINQEIASLEELLESKMDEYFCEKE